MRCGVATWGAVAFTLSLAATKDLTAPVGVWYVNGQALGANDGTSWADAFMDLHDALAVAVAGDEVWIAAGTYKPDRGTGDRNMSFLIPAGVALYGGFDGWETDREQRDRVPNPTILSGDLNGDDGPRDCAEHSDCCRVHDYPGCDDHFCQVIICSIRPQCCQQSTFTDWDRQCADLAAWKCCNLNGWHACENSIVIARLAGGDPTTVLDTLVVEGAYGSSGAGIRGNNSAVSVFHVAFRNNIEFGMVGIGRCRVDDCTIVGNVTALSALQADVSNSSFTGNDGGIVIANDSFTTAVGTVSNCTFANNGVALAVFGSMFSLATVTIRDSSFVENHPVGYMVDLIDAIVTVAHCTFERNSGVTVGAFDTYLAIDRCAFVESHGTALDVTQVSALVQNSLFSGVTSVAISSTDSLLLVDNCTLHANADSLGRPLGIVVGEGRTVLRDTILRGSPGDPEDIERELVKVAPPPYTPPMEFDNCLVQGWTGRFGGTGNSGADPLFIDPIGPDGIPGTGDDDLRLSPGSPGINAGILDPTGLGSTDLDGHARMLCGRVDIGAYEFGIGDYTCDQSVDLSDFAAFQNCFEVSPISGACLVFDFNADHSIDLLDFAGFQATWGNP